MGRRACKAELLGFRNDTGLGGFKVMGLRVFRAGTLDKPKEHQSLEIYNCRMGEQLRSPSKDCEVLRKQVANSLTSGIALTR